jgi:hypothetical protein
MEIINKKSSKPSKNQSMYSKLSITLYKTLRIWY